MKTENKVLMKQAQEALTGKWGLAIGTFFVYFLIVMMVQLVAQVVPTSLKFIASLASLLISGPLVLGLSTFSLAISRNREARLEQIFSGFNKFWLAVGAYFLMGIFMFLWFLLLIIPGIIAAISYSQTFFIMADDDSISPSDAIDKSKKMMDGNKAKYFRLCLRFFGLSLLCILTLGIAFLWLYPYMMVGFAKFYDDINGGENKNAGTPDFGLGKDQPLDAGII